MLNFQFQPIKKELHTASAHSADKQSSDSLRVLLFSIGNKTHKTIVSRLREQLPASAQLIVAGKKGSDIVMSGLIRIKRRGSKSKQAQRNSTYSGSGSSLTSSTQFNEASMMALDHLQRRTENFTWSHNRLTSVYDCLQYYHVTVDIVAETITRNQINLILFLNTPHLFYDTIAYHIAQEFRIRTLILTHSHFSNRFFSFNALEDFGRIPQKSNKDFSEPFSIDKNKKPEWEYMAKVKQYQGELGKLDSRGILALICHLLTTQPIAFLRFGYFKQCLNRMRRIASTFPSWRYPFAQFFHIRHLAYFEKLMEYESCTVDLECDFVYFPLQLQPELTTSTLGGNYSDQILAIEKLAEIVPDDCFIYVKENPKQRGAMRGKQFFDRLLRIRNVRIVPSFTDTHELISHSIFVATVTGTAGWEAICKGKVVLYFGIPWYRDLEGAVSFHDEITYRELCGFKLDHSKLERDVGRLHSRTHKGTLLFTEKNKSEKKHITTANAEVIVDTIMRLIERQVEPTFCKDQTDSGRSNDSKSRTLPYNT